MKDKRQDSSSDNLSKATEWFVRRHSDVTSARDDQQFCEWLSEDSNNSDRMEEVEQHWLELEGLSSWADQELHELSRRRSTGKFWSPPRAFALAASLCAVALIGVFWITYQNPTVRVETAKTEQRQLTLDDGSRVHLNTESIVEVSYSDASRQVVLESGETVFDVAHDSKRPFVVTVEGISVIAVGTRFSVRHDFGEPIRVTVIDGKVAVVKDVTGLRSRVAPKPIEIMKTEGVIVGKDEQVTIDPQGKVSAVKHVNAREVTSWLEGKLIFRETPLKEVVTEISRYVPGEILVVPEIAETPVSGILYIRSKESMVELLASAVSVIPVRESSETIVLHPAAKVR